MRWFIKISLVDTTEMREILVTRRVSGRRLKMRESPARCGRLGRSEKPLNRSAENTGTEKRRT